MFVRIENLYARRILYLMNFNVLLQGTLAVEYIVPQLVRKLN